MGESTWLMKFGKYRGKDINDVPSGYLRWMTRQDNYDPTAIELAHTILNLRGADPNKEPREIFIPPTPQVTPYIKKEWIRVGPSHVADKNLIKSLKPSKSKIIDENDPERVLEFVCVFEQGTFGESTKRPSVWLTAEEASALATILLGN